MINKRMNETLITKEKIMRISFPPHLKLSNTPTQIKKLETISKELNKDVYIWRDDLTGCFESGNKVRRLEFLLQDALQQNCDWILTCGAPQSNHMRVSAVLARQLGLGITLITTDPNPKEFETKSSTGNFLINQILGAEIKFINTQEFIKAERNFNPFLKVEGELLKKEGKKPYLIPVGGSCPLGCFGYIKGIEEMISSWKELEPKSPYPSSIFCAVGSGGTHAGMFLGTELYHLQTKIFGVIVNRNKEYFEKVVMTLVKKTSEEYHLPIEADFSKKIHILDGYLGDGYGLTTDNDLRFYSDLAQKEGIILDPCYTGKAFKGMISELKQSPEKYGEKILFLHSGGAFGLFGYQEQFFKALKKS